MWRRLRQACIPAGLILLVPLGLTAQDSHYWSHQYGGRSILLTGAVIGNINDASAAYYNPAGLARAAEEEVFLGTQVFDLANIRIENEEGEETTLDSDDLGRAPSFLGGILPLGLGRNRFAYAVFKRHSFDLRVDGNTFGKAEIDGDGTSQEAVYARVTFDAKLSERWFGGTWSFPVSKTLSLGISTFLARRQQWLEINSVAESLLGNGNVALTTGTDYYKFWHYRLLWKAGMELDLDQISFGITFTSPGVKIYGTGERIVNEVESGLEGNGEGEDVMVADVQEAVDVTYKSPVSAAAGLSMVFDRRAVHVTVEVFNNIDPYPVLNLQPAFGQSPTDPIPHDVYAASDGVVNTAIGLEEYFSDGFRGYLSISTDYSSALEEGVTNLSVTRWDLYHLTAGTTFEFGNARFTFGLGYAFGSADSQRIAAPANGGVSTVFDEPVPSKIEYQRLKFILGFALRTS